MVHDIINHVYDEDDDRDDNDEDDDHDDEPIYENTKPEQLYENTNFSVQGNGVVNPAMRQSDEGNRSAC